MVSVLRAEDVPETDWDVVEVFVGALEYALSENFSNMILDILSDELSGVFSVEFEPLFWVCVNQMNMGSHVFFTGEVFGHFASSLRLDAGNQLVAPSLRTLQPARSSYLDS